jgi:hypothetical protein
VQLTHPHFGGRVMAAFTAAANEMLDRGCE